MKYEGNLLKMKSKKMEVVHYFLQFNNTDVFLNELIGRTVNIIYEGRINCIKCGKTINNSFGQGFCYPCFQSAPEAEECVLRPELCKAHEGIARDMEYAVKHCLIPHYVYLSFTGDYKVGVTRNTQIPTRWIDQGATAAVKIAKTENRYQAGLIEVALKKVISDKTNWRNMLKDIQADNKEMSQQINYIKENIPSELKKYIIPHSEIINISYPVKNYPAKVKSINLDKTCHFSAKLSGIKGQYLLFNTDDVMNVRNHSGYYIYLDVK